MDPAHPRFRQVTQGANALCSCPPGEHPFPVGKERGCEGAAPAVTPAAPVAGGAPEDRDPGCAGCGTRNDHSHGMGCVKRLRALEAAPVHVEDEPTRRVKTESSAQLLADARALATAQRYLEELALGTGYEVKVGQLPSGRWTASMVNGAGVTRAIWTPDLEKAVFFIERRLRGAL